MILRYLNSSVFTNEKYRRKSTLLTDLREEELFISIYDLIFINKFIVEDMFRSILTIFIIY